MRNRVIDNSAQNNLVVHNTGNETIAGNKTFTGDIKSSSLNVTGNASFGGNTSVAGLNSTGNVTVAGTTSVAGLNVTGNASFGGNTSVAGLNSTGNATVAGTTITSNLTVNNNMTINGNIDKNVTADVSTLPDNNMYWIPFNVDNSDESLKAYQQISYLTNGLLRNSYGLRRTVNGVNVFNSIDLGIDSSGNTSTSVITPPLNNNSTEIATTAFVKSVLSSSGNGLATFSKEKNGYCKFSNGVIMQWGVIEISTYNQTGTVTLPTAFSSANYGLGSMGERDTGNGQGELSITDTKNETSFSYRSTASTTNFNKKHYWLAIGY